MKVRVMNPKMDAPAGGMLDGFLRRGEGIEGLRAHATMQIACALMPAKRRGRIQRDLVAAKWWRELLEYAEVLYAIHPHPYNWAS